MHNLKANFDKIFQLAKSIFDDQLDSLMNFRPYRRSPKMSDLEIITLSCLAEAMSIDSENLLFSKLRSDYKHHFPHLIDRSNFNRRRKKLSSKAAELSRSICLRFAEPDSEFIIDSIPVPICSNVRISRSVICKDDPEVMPSRAFHASHKVYYYGFKMQLVISKQGLPFAAGLTTASMHDSQYIPFLKEDQLPQCQLIGDKGYISTGEQISLFEEAKVRLITPLKTNMKAVSLWNDSFRYMRKRIETLLSQLCDQLMLKRNYAKTSEGLFARLVSKIASVSVLQALNLMAGRPANHIKHALKN